MKISTDMLDTEVALTLHRLRNFTVNCCCGEISEGQTAPGRQGGGCMSDPVSTLL